MDDLAAQEVPGADAIAIAPAGEGAQLSNEAGMAVNLIGLGLIVAGVIFMIMGGLVGWIIGMICLIGGVGALFLTWQRKRRAGA